MIDGITITEAGTGPQTLLCLHGIGGDASSFHHQMALSGWRVVAWNMPGYQGSEIRMNPPDFAHLSGRLGAVIERLGGAVHLLGHSIGGMIALDHALRCPAQVTSLTLLATTPRFGGRDGSFKDAFLKARLGALDAGQTMAEMAAKTAPHLVGADTDLAEIDHIERGLAAVPVETWRGILKCLVTFDCADDLGTVTCPVLAISGSEDRNAPAATMQKMASRLPDAHYHEISGAGHMPHQEMPQRVNALLAAFLKDRDV